MNQIQEILARAVVLGAISSALLFAGCDVPWQGVQGSGVSKTESREVSDFTKINIEGHGVIHIAFGDEPSVQLTCDDNLLEFVEAEVVGDELKIWHTETIDPTDSLRVDIVMKNLTDVDLSGAAKMSIQSIQSDRLNLSISGSANIEADGTVDDVVIEVSGAAKIAAKDLRSRTMKISISGAGKAEVFASESLEASVSGAGKINCLGNPSKVKKDISGVGRIVVDEASASKAEAE
jgi:hypothetical protein